MSAVPVEISGQLYDKTNKTRQNVTLIGFASIVGLSVGGGPAEGGEPPIPPDPDLGIWSDPGGYNPDDPGQPWPPETPPNPPFEIKTAWTPENGWFIAIIPTGTHVTPSRKK